MKGTYRDPNTWHYTDPVSGNQPDLHHGLLRKDLGGGKFIYAGSLYQQWATFLTDASSRSGSGIAIRMNLCDVDGDCFSYGTQCEPNFGFGLSTDVKGSITDLDGIPTMFW